MGKNRELKAAFDLARRMARVDLKTLIRVTERQEISEEELIRCAFVALDDLIAHLEKKGSLFDCSRSWQISTVISARDHLLSALHK